MTGRGFLIGALAAVAIGGIAARPISAADKPTPWMGTWVLDIARSSFTPGPPLKSNTFVVSDAGDGRLHETMDYVNGHGKATHLAFAAAFDGKPVAVIGSADLDSVTFIPYASAAFKFEFKKGDKLVQWGFLEVDKERKTLHGPMYGVAPDGTRWKYHYVFERT
jgi:hypothetical protein